MLMSYEEKLNIFRVLSRFGSNVSDSLNFAYGQEIVITMEMLVGEFIDYISFIKSFIRFFKRFVVFVIIIEIIVQHLEIERLQGLGERLRKTGGNGPAIVGEFSLLLLLELVEQIIEDLRPFLGVFEVLQEHGVKPQENIGPLLIESGIEVLPYPGELPVGIMATAE